jgi:hypothetical protein
MGQVGQVHRPPVAEQFEDLCEFGSFARRMVMSAAWEAPSRVPSVIIVVSSFRVGVVRPGGLFPAGRQILKGSSEVVALGADTVGLATTQRGLLFQKGANRNDSSQIRAVNAEGNHLS